MRVVFSTSRGRVTMNHNSLWSSDTDAVNAEEKKMIESLV